MGLATSGIHRVLQGSGKGDDVRNDRDLDMESEKSVGSSDGELYHMETLVCVFLRRFTGCRIDANPLAVVSCGFTDPFNGSQQIFVECSTNNRTANVVSKIPWTD